MFIIFGPFSCGDEEKHINKSPGRSRDNPVKILFTLTCDNFRRRKHLKPYCVPSSCGFIASETQTSGKAFLLPVSTSPYTRQCRGPLLHTSPSLCKSIFYQRNQGYCSGMQFGVLPGVPCQRLLESYFLWILAEKSVALDGRNRARVIAESLARVIAAIRITSVHWRSYLPLETQNLVLVDPAFAALRFKSRDWRSLV